MRSSLIVVLLCGILPSCADKPHPENEPALISADTTSMGSSVLDGTPISFEQVADNISHDTLLIQTTFDLRDGTYLMVASNSLAEEMLDAGDRNAGLRLYHYRMLADGSPQVLAVSTPALDSWTMFPTFFNDPLEQNSYLILANFGERNSWWQKVFLFGPEGFTELGALNVATIEREGEGEGDEVETKLRNIGPHTRVGSIGNELVFSFDLDELMLFDDLRGMIDQPIKADRVNYRWSEENGLLMYIDGEARREQQPS